MSEPSLDLLQRMIQKVLDNQQRNTDSLSDITNRMTSLEFKVATLHGILQISPYGSIGLKRGLNGLSGGSTS